MAALALIPSIIGGAFKNWKLVGVGFLALALGVQTMRVGSLKRGEIACQAQAKAWRPMRWPWPISKPLSARPPRRICAPAGPYPDGDQGDRPQCPGLYHPCG